MRLTDDELLEAAAPRGKLFTVYNRDQCRRVADKAAEKVLRVLSEKCGDDPCKGCDQGVCLGNPEEIGCDARTFYKGMMAQAAKDEQERANSRRGEE